MQVNKDTLSNKKFEILIPTYNRCEFLIKNILHIEKVALNCGVEESISVIVSDNASSDDTMDRLSELIIDIKIHVNIFSQERNVGLEKNALFVLSQSTSDYVMFCGDDDFIHHHYLKFIFEKIAEGAVSCIIPSYIEVFPDGRRIERRRSSANYKVYQPGFACLLKNSVLGHQMSGLVVKRGGIYKRYIENSQYGNIYPFIYFVSAYMLQFKCIFAPGYPVEVMQGNRKDWKYDSVGLLDDMLKNTYMLDLGFWGRSLLCFCYIFQQRWRLMLSKKSFFNKAKKSYCALIRSPYVPFLTKIFLPFIYFYLYFDRFFSRMYRSFKKRF